jgi:hypothetical protein
MKKRIRNRKKTAEEAAVTERAAVTEKETEQEEPTAEVAEKGGEAEEASPLDRLAPGERAALIAALASRMRREEEEAMAELAEDANYADIGNCAEELRALPARFPFLNTLPTKERLAAAYLMYRGLAEKPRTAEERLEELLSDPAMLRALSEKFSRLLAARREATPPIPVRSGTAVPPADRRPSPRDLREAATAAKRYLGIKEN